MSPITRFVTHFSSLL